MGEAFLPLHCSVRGSATLVATMPSEPSALRALPKVDVLAADERFLGFSDSQRILAARVVLAESREEILRGGEAGDLSAAMHRVLADTSKTQYKQVINLSGVILHTGLGRARLVFDFTDVSVLPCHTDLEFDLETGQRGDRMKWVRPLLQDLTGAEDALVVNNCAAGVLLTLSALGGPVILSRGQMVEIGGSFRMPDVVAASGSLLIEVGCTNKTHLSDYALAISVAGSIGVVLRCSKSNFRQSGFVHDVTPAELAALAHEKKWIFVDDVGSGCILDTTEFGLPHERTLAESVSDGADIVIASGDKLLGGPQAGIILGSAALIKQIKSHPVARAVRADKLTVALLSQTLKKYQQGRARDIPVWESVGRSAQHVREQAESLAHAYPHVARVEPGFTQFGAGSMPGVGVPTFRTGLKSSDPGALAATLRSQAIPIIGAIEHGQFWLDPRTAAPHEIEVTQRTLRAL